MYVVLILSCMGDLVVVLPNFWSSFLLTWYMCFDHIFTKMHHLCAQVPNMYHMNAEPPFFFLSKIIIEPPNCSPINLLWSMQICIFILSWNTLGIEHFVLVKLVWWLVSFVFAHFGHNHQTIIGHSIYSFLVLFWHFQSSREFMALAHSWRIFVFIFIYFSSFQVFTCSREFWMCLFLFCLVDI
jgi:hypothetical protein